MICRGAFSRGFLSLRLWHLFKWHCMVDQLCQSKSTLHSKDDVSSKLLIKKSPRILLYHYNLQNIFSNPILRKKYVRHDWLSHISLERVISNEFTTLAGDFSLMYTLIARKGLFYRLTKRLLLNRHDLRLLSVQDYLIRLYFSLYNLIYSMDYK